VISARIPVCVFSLALDSWRLHYATKGETKMQIFAPLPWWLKATLWLVRLARRWDRGRRAVLLAKNHLLCGSFYELHIKVVHRWRDFVLAAHDWQHYESLPPDTKELCNGCRDCLAEILDVPQNRLHCTIKVLVQGDATQEGLIVTIGRSDPCDRPPEYGLEDAHRVDRNTVFAALCGRSDGYKNWPPYSYFGCNDLPKHAARFACDRGNWAQWYRSTLALPLRFRDPQDRHNYKIIGFLTFDMPTTGEFNGVPDAFEHEYSEYQELLGGAAVMHAAGIMADTLALLLRPFLVKGREDGEQQQRAG
jgi:hypothetical protein